MMVLEAVLRRRRPNGTWWAVCSMLVCAAILMALTGRGSSNADQTSPLDLAALRAKAKLDLPVRAVAWEVFGTPEYKGGAPGPTDLPNIGSGTRAD